MLLFFGCFLILISSGSVFSAVLFRKRFECTLPFTCMGIVAILYLFGLMNILIVGVYVALILLFLLYLIAVVLLIKNKNRLQISKLIFTPPFFIFIFLCFGLIFANKGRLASSWDEFSHWVDCVKVMTSIDGFITNPEASSAFQSYPPAMALFQYFFQKIYALFNPNTFFAEDIIYFCFQVFSLSYFFPFLKRFTLEKPLIFCVSLIILFFVPLFFYQTFYSHVYIDPFVGLVAGCCFALVLLEKEKDSTYHIYVALSCFILVLAKDVGLYFACFIAIAYALNHLIRQNWKPFSLKKHIIPILVSLIPLSLTLFAKLTWKLEIKIKGAEQSFGNTIDILYYTKMFFLGGDSTYRQLVVDRFQAAFFSRALSLGNTGLSITYFTLFLFFVVALVLLYIILKRHLKTKKETIATIVTLSIVILQFVLYIYSLGATYVSNFSEYEALRLASYERYMNMTYLSVFIVIIFSLLYSLQNIQRKHQLTFSIIILAIFLALSPVIQAFRFVSRREVSKSRSVRAEYNNICNDIQIHCEEQSHIFLISQEDSGFDYWVTRYSVRPHLIDNAWMWSLGEPFYEGDIWTFNLSVEEWQSNLLKNDYDYVAIYNVNDYFKATYASVFENASEIENYSLFKVNKETGILTRVDK